mmetsp:Transcript_10928/g.32507  ORF Transcript_10928/g.32507 Transcript_10928/m.32507 type:complete len:276 (-) Transcript_10928:111-938(-)
MSLLGGEMQNCTSAILAFSIRVGPPAVLAAFWSNTRPSTISESSTVPPGLATMRMSFRSSMLGRAGSMTFSTASTAMDENNPLYCDTTLLLREVVAALRSCSRSSRFTGIAIDVSRISHAFSAALLKASETTVGWTPLSSNSCVFFSNAPQMTTTDVVPSPATTSCDLESSTSIFAAGCVTVMRCKMVAPSFVMMTLPSGEAIILSMPRGPRDVRTASATAFAASMLVVRTSFFFVLSRYISPRLPRGAPPAAPFAMVPRSASGALGRSNGASRW